jgi:hypothetical protein
LTVSKSQQVPSSGQEDIPHKSDANAARHHFNRNAKPQKELFDEKWKEFTYFCRFRAAEFSGGKSQANPLRPKRQNQPKPRPQQQKN